MPIVTIDGVQVEVAPGTSILNAARKIGGDLVPPAMCYYSKLEGSGGKCRVCLVEISKRERPESQPGAQIAGKLLHPDSRWHGSKEYDVAESSGHAQRCGGIFAD